jgi:dUTP pyrophosphatase
MAASFARRLLEVVGIPPAAQFLHGRHIDGAVVQVVVNLGHPLGQEASVGADRVSAQWHVVVDRNVLFQEVECLLHRLFMGHRGCSNGVEEPRAGVHLNDHVVHMSQGFGRGCDDEVWPFGDDVEIVVSEEGGNFDNHVPLGIEAGHFEIHPRQHEITLCGRRAQRELEPSPIRHHGGMPSVRVVRIDPEVPLPTYAKAGDGAMDLTSRVDATLAAGGGRALLPTGLTIALPDGWAGLVLSRSGLAARHGVCVLNSPGLVDAGYRGEIMVPLVNLDPVAVFEVRRGDRIAQFMAVPVERVEWDEFLVLEESERGSGGFGHTGR